MKSHPDLMRAGIQLGCATGLGLGLLTLIHGCTEPLVSRRETNALIQHIQTVLPEEMPGNDWVNREMQSSADLKPGDAPVWVYPVRHGQQPVALIAETISYEGYNGPIHLLIVIAADGRLRGVRVISHRETPGLGDRIDLTRSDWMQGFAGRSLSDPPASRWTVKRDGGDFDQFAGATITPRAVVKAVKKTLIWFQANQDVLQ